MTKILVILSVLLAGSVFSQKAIVEYYEYSIDNGLVDNWVNDFEKDDNGFVWIATNDGISRFDGYNFINFSGDNQTLIPRNSRFQDLQLQGDLMYAISRENGIYSINTKTLKIIHVDKSGVVSYDKLGNQTWLFLSNLGMSKKN